MHKHKLNLIPEKILKERLEKRLQWLFSFALMICIGIILITVFVLDNRINFIDSELQSLTKRWSLVVKKSEERELQNAESILREKYYNILTQKPRTHSLIFKDIIEDKPQEVFIHNIMIRDKKLLLVEGTSSKLSHISQLLEKIQHLKEVVQTSVEFTRIQKEAENPIIHYFFEITAHLKEDEGG